MSLDMSASAIDTRLRRVSELAAPLRPENRLDTKIDMSATGVELRLREASELLELCRRLSRSGRQGTSAQAGGLSSMARR